LRDDDFTLLEDVYMFSYFSVVVEHKNAGNIKIVFLKTSDNLIPIASTDLEINDLDAKAKYIRLKPKFNLDFLV